MIGSTPPKNIIYCSVYLHAVPGFLEGKAGVGRWLGVSRHKSVPFSKDVWRMECVEDF